MNHYKQIVVHGCSFLTIPFEEENINRKGVNFDLIKQSLPKEYHHLNINRKFIESRAPDIYKKMVHYHDILHEYVFSTRLGKKLGCDVQNLSKPGANNQQMIRRLYEWINEMDKEDKTLIILGLTDISRFEIWDSIRNSHLSITVDLDFSDDISLNDEHKRHFEFHYKNLYSDEERIKSLQRELEMFQSYCNERNIDIIIFGSLFGVNSDHKDWKYFLRKKDYHLSLNTDSLNWFTFPNGINDWRSYIYSYDKNYGFGHPMASDHEHLADLFYDYISKSLL
jgi:predicted nuclease of predicted toxin-antitoxin system